MTTPTLSRLEVERHAADAARELDHLAGLDVVEAVDAGDAVADGQHLADFGDLGFLAEILDLILEDCGNFRGADVHQPTSFIASLSELSLVLSEVSIMREPTLTTRPPISDGSTVTLSVTSLPATALQGCLELRLLMLPSAHGRWSLRRPPGRGVRGNRPERLDHARNSEQAAVACRDAQEIADQTHDLARSATADTAFTWSSAENTGLLISRKRSSLSSNIRSKRGEILVYWHRPHCLAEPISNSEFA